jgi:hypothetical protein
MDEVPWIEGRWGEFRKLSCKFCAWDTLEGEDAFWKHFLAVHAPPEPPRPAGTILRADRWGNPVNEETEE